MPYKDRTAGLIAFGVLTILLGLAAGGLALLTLLGQALVPEDQRVGMAALIPAVSMYVVLAVALVILGIGSIMAKRWARALLLIFSWSWLIVGSLDTLVTAIILPMALSSGAMQMPPDAGKGPPPAAMMGCVMVFTFAILGFIFVLLPGIWTFFYYSPHVKATCDARDPNPNWTDSCPLPVLAVSLWLWFCVPMMLLMPFSGHVVMPLFGLILTGPAAILLCLVFACIWGVGGWLTYKVNILGWWLVLAMFILVLISSVITFSIHDVLDLYRAMDYPQKQIEQIQKMGLFTGHSFIVLMSLAMLPFIGYLLFIRRYFVRQR